MADVFISYARATGEVAQLIAQALRDEGYDVWVDDALPLHREFATVIEEKLREAKAVLVLWSPEARASRWVLAEADLGHEGSKLVQLSLDGAPPPFPFNGLHCEIAPDWNGDLKSVAWRKILDSIDALTHRPAPAAAATQRATAPAPRPSAKAAPTERLLAVLAFDNLSGDAELADFCDGVSEEIQQTVARSSALRVVARSSSFQFRGPDKAVDKVAAALKTTHLLDGSVRRSGSRVRIGAQLVECAGGSTLWANRFDGDLTDVFALQDRIAEQVAKALEITFQGSAPSRPLAPDAYETFLRARRLMNEGDEVLGAASREAVPLLESVTEAASDYAAGWELLALARARLLRYAPEGAADEAARNSALAAAEKALALDPSRGGALVALSILQPWGDYRAREDLLTEAIRLAPSNPDALTHMSELQASVGRLREALAYAEKACEINPMMPTARLTVASLRYAVGDYSGSIRMQQELVERWPANLQMLLSLLNCAATGGFWREFDEAAERIARFEGKAADWLHAARTFGEALRSPDEAFRERRLANYRRVFEKTGFLALNLVESLSQLGFTEEALSMALESHYDVFNPLAPMPSRLYYAVILTPWSTLKTSPRFMTLCDQLGLVDYWVGTDRWPDCAGWTAYDFKAEVRRTMRERQAAPVA